MKKGERTRKVILDRALDLASSLGLEGLTIGRLAADLGLSKSGLFAHFGSKEELQLATVDKAYEMFVADVIGPALERPEGLARVEALCEGFLSHVEREVFAGGCFFAAAAAELDTRPGAVRDRIAGIHRDWAQLVESSVEAAQRSGELDPAVDPDQLTFELLAMLAQANGSWVLFRDPAVFGRARRGLAARIEQARPKA